MKTILVILPLTIVLCFMISCQDKEAMRELQELKNQAQLEEQNKDIIIRWLSETDKENFAVIDELMAKDGKIYYGRDIFPPEWLKASCKVMAQSFSGNTHIIDDLIAEKDKVVARLTIKVIHTGEFMGTLPTGKEVEYHGFTVYRLEAGKIKELWMDQNATLELLVKLGINPESMVGE
jgi:predicted ester cyclase